MALGTPYSPHTEQECSYLQVLVGRIVPSAIYSTTVQLFSKSCLTPYLNFGTMSTEGCILPSDFSLLCSDYTLGFPPPSLAAYNICKADSANVLLWSNTVICC